MVTNKITILALCIGMVGCLNSEDKKSTSSETSSEISSVTMSSVSSDKSCSPSRQGSIIYDQAQSQFFFCSDGAWTAVDLKGPKGDKGEAGAVGSAGLAGAPGAPGLSGANGRDGMDGDGIRLALKENGQVKGILIQYLTQGSAQLALMMLPNGDLIYIDVNTGIFGGKPMRVYYTEAGCGGVAYTGRADYLGPHTVGRVYVGPSNNGTAIAFYRAEEWVTGFREFKSARAFDTSGQMYQCENWVQSTSNMVRVVEIPIIPSLSHLAPIRFTP